MRIHITGASGSGTSTLGVALAEAIRGVHLEADNYYWLPTDPPFKSKRNPVARLSMLMTDLSVVKDPVLAGSIVGWGSEVEDSFDLVVFLYLDTQTRIERLRQREMQRYGQVDPAFLVWASQYDSGPPEGRSLAKHRAWLADRKCPIVELRGDLTVQDRVDRVLEHLPSG